MINTEMEREERVEHRISRSQRDKSDTSEKRESVGVE